MTKLRDMKASDIPDIMQIEKECFNEPWTADNFLYELRKKVAHNWVVLCDNKPCAYMCFWEIGSELQLNNIAVRKDVRRQGIAQKLLDRMIQYASDQHIKSITLEVSEQNRTAIKFYDKQGFKQIGIRPLYYEYDLSNALILTKKLENV